MYSKLLPKFRNLVFDSLWVTGHAGIAVKVTITPILANEILWSL